MGIVLIAVLALGSAGGGASLSEASKELRRALAVQNLKRLDRTISKLRKTGGKQAVLLLAEAARRVSRQNNELYWVLVDGIASFGDREALRAVGDFIVRHARTQLAQDILFALDRNVLSTKVEALALVLQRAPEPLAFGAIRQLAALPAPEAVDALIARLEVAKKKEFDLKQRIAAALSALTGQNFGTNAELWKMWWAANRNKPLGAEREDRRRTGTAIDEADALRARQIIGLEKLPKPRIVVIKGKHVDADRFDHNFDHIEYLLDQMELPHTVITKEDFEAGFRLDRTMVVCINCMMWRAHCVCPKCKPGVYTGNRLHRCTGCNIHDMREYKFSNAACKRLAAFVRRGGYLFTEDWVLEELLERVFPQFIVSGPKLDDANVKVFPGPGAASHPYLQGVFHHDKEAVIVRGKSGGGARTGPYRPPAEVKSYFTPSEYKWKIDKDSPAIVVKNKRRVQILLASPELGRMAEGNDALAVTFSPGRSRLSGKVLHILSHFGKQTTRNSEYGIQNLLLNFLIDANLHRGALLSRAGNEK